MLNRNDPLIGAVQEVMRKNQAERDAVKAVNEKFGVVDRRALPHEQQANWDAAYNKVISEGVEVLNEEMSEKQKKLAKVGNKAGLGGNPKIIDAPDLEGARKGHAKHIEEEEQIDEISADLAARAARKAGNKSDAAADANHHVQAKAYGDQSQRLWAKSTEKREAETRKKDIAGLSSGKKTAYQKRYGKLKEEAVHEVAPPGREDQVKALKGKVGKKSAFAIAWASYNKKKGK